MNNISFPKSFYFEKIKYDNLTLRGPKKIIWRILGLVFVLVLIALSIYFIDFSFAPNGRRVFSQNIIDFFRPHLISKLIPGQNLFLLSIKYLWESIKVAFLGTIIGTCLALFTAFFSNYKMNKYWIAIPIKFIIIVLRLLPELFFIYLFQISADKTLAINLIFSWFTWLWLHEYFSQVIENANFEIFYWLTKIKQNRFTAFFKEIWPQISPKILNYIFYAFESNIRWSTILSKLGFLGIGILIYPNSINVNYFHELLIPLLILATFLIFIEFCNFIISNLLFYSRTQKVNIKKYAKNSTIKKIIIFIAIAIGLIITIFACLSLRGEKFYSTQGNYYFKELFNGEWKNVFLGWKTNSNFGLLYMLLQLGALVLLSILLTYFISYFKLLLLSRQLFKRSYWIEKIWNTILRSIPVISLFLLISNLFNKLEAAFVIAFAIHSSSTISRMLESSIKKISTKKINELKIKGYSKFYIFRNFIMPTIKLDLITFMTFEIEKITRNFITYGLFSASLLGSETNLGRYKEISDIAPYLWIEFIIIGLINLGNYLYRLRLNKGSIKK